MITINIPDNATNEDVLNIVFKNDDSLSIRADRHGFLHMRGVKEDWLKHSYKQDDKETV